MKVESGGDYCRLGGVLKSIICMKDTVRFCPLRPYDAVNQYPE